MAIPDRGSVLGIDVGFSPRRRSSAVCRLDWTPTEISWEIDRFRALDQDRQEAVTRVAGSKTISCVAVDGPMRRNFDLIGRYRIAEQMLTRQLFRLIGKPGQSSSPVGRSLNTHANACAKAAMALGTLLPASHKVKIDALAIVEAFPSSFLGFLIEDPKSLSASRSDRSDTFFVHLVSSGGIDRLMNRLLPGRRFTYSLEALTNHDDRAGLVCAFTALCVECGDYSAVGDTDGWIILPPRAMIRDWGWRLLEANAEHPFQLQHETPH